jgi:6-phosphofructokinase 1
MTPSNIDLFIPNLGPCSHPSPGLLKHWDASSPTWIPDESRILIDDRLETIHANHHAPERLLSVERAGPRQLIRFDPRQTVFGIVTCGGICPGLNDVIRSLVMHSHHGYGVRKILGLPYGFESLNPAYGHRPETLTPERVSMIHHMGGSILGTSRGMQDPKVMVDQLVALGITVLFVVGGDGSQRGALRIYEEITRRNLCIGVVGIPKTIDNDLLSMDRSFGYHTACAEAFRTLCVAHSEARGSRQGVGLVKLMGRDSGFIACAAALASGDVNFVLIPEVPFRLEGEAGLLACLEKRLHSRGHAVLVAAEGAGQELLPDVPSERDASGNKRYGDIGAFLKERIQAHFRSKNLELNLKYIDPSYELRGGLATPEDRVFCLQLARHAVHAAMAGKTGMVVARWHQRFVHLPASLVASGRRKVDEHGDLWRCVLETTGQPARMH